MASLTCTRRNGKGESRQDKAKELRATIDASIDTLAKAVDDVRASDVFRGYLAVQARCIGCGKNQSNGSCALDTSPNLWHNTGRQEKWPRDADNIRGRGQHLDKRS